ncbi:MULTISPECIES: efflux RND transporter periplasmic adaptor subunit [Sphingomonadaceae]|uniref:efflux RND transporter periplasmic adaptor subunit n=1 Tax=Sphingomonadaceae TaxID=41297 RepID=UPI00115ABA9C|nr:MULTISPECIES: efflux RND transporter periplasmic adaptor subunit [Sphingomonadaceae]QDK32179.1 efflux RND transporter periplasmic adaptor subunit [Sphingomonas sp. IC081]QSR18912.1 efflux transporter periplasmic adaptor subunit [Novosphingobium sp. KA1]
MADETLDEFLGADKRALWQRKWAVWTALAVLVVLALLLSQCFRGAEKTAYATTRAEKGRLVTTVSATGKLAPTNQVTVGSQLSGLVVKVLVDVNDRVKKGQVLAEIDPEQIEDQIRQYTAQVNANLAQVAQNKATLAESQAQLARLEEVSRLSGGKVPSKTELQAGRADVQRAAAAVKTAEANVAAARATLAQSQTQRSRALIVSPVSGVVLAREVDPGQTVASSFNTPTLFVIAEDLSSMKLEVAIDEADVGTVKEGQAATFTVDAFPGDSFPAKITRVEIGSNLTVSSATSSSSTATTSSSSGQVVSYAADLSVANADFRLRPGMTATAEIVTSDKTGVLLIPNAALSFTPQSAGAGGKSGGVTSAIGFRPPRRGGGGASKSATLERGSRRTIYVLGADGTPQAVEIVMGSSNGQQTEVTGGSLRPGMEVITGQLAPGGS